MNDDQRDDAFLLHDLFAARVSRRGIAGLIAATAATVRPSSSPRRDGIAVLDVRSFGARCDGVTDDTRGIQAAVAALPRMGGTIYLPGVCRTTAMIDARDRSNLQFRGHSPEASGIHLDVSDRTTPCVAVGQTESRHGTHTVYDVRFADLCLRNSRSPGHGVGVAVFDAARVTFDRCHISYLADGIVVPAGRWLSQMAVRDCIIEFCAGIGIRCDGDAAVRTLFGVSVRGCRIVHNRSHGILFQYGSDLYVSGASSIAGNHGDGIHVLGSAVRPVRCQSVRIEHADIDSNWGYNIYFDEVEQSSITALWSGGAGGQGAPRTGAESVPESAIADRAGIYLENTRSTSITGTTTAYNSRHGIHLKNCQGVTVLGAHAMSNGHAVAGSTRGGAGIFVEGETHSLVSLIGCSCTGVMGDGRQDYGILVDSSCREDVNLVGCTAFDSSTRDFQNDAGANVRCVGCDFRTAAGVASITATGRGLLYADAATGLHEVVLAHEPPTSGSWRLGDRVYNAAPAAGGKLGWVCVRDGSPGLWKAFGAIDA